MHKVVCCGERGLFEEGHGNGVLIVDGHCEAGFGPPQRCWCWLEIDHMAAWPRVLHCTLVPVTHKAVCRGERGLCGIGHGNGVLSVDCHCEAGHVRGTYALARP